MGSKIRLQIGVGGKPERRFRRYLHVFGTKLQPAAKQRDLQHLVPASLRRHRNQLSPDQFDALVLVEDAGLDHRLDVGHGETPAG